LFEGKGKDAADSLTVTRRVSLKLSGKEIVGVEDENITGLEIKTRKSMSSIIIDDLSRRLNLGEDDGKFG